MTSSDAPALNPEAPPFELTLQSTPDVCLPEAEIRQGVALAWRAHVEAGGDVTLAELSVTFLDDPEILELNRRHLAHDWVPDVLSFALEATPDHRVGDLYIGINQAARQASEHGVTLDEELVRLAVHGTLHVLGFDHPEDDLGRAAAPMTRVQEAIVRQIFQ